MKLLNLFAILTFGCTISAISLADVPKTQSAASNVKPLVEQEVRQTYYKVKNVEKNFRTPLQNPQNQKRTHNKQRQNQINQTNQNLKEACEKNKGKKDVSFKDANGTTAHTDCPKAGNKLYQS